MLSVNVDKNYLKVKDGIDLAGYKEIGKHGANQMTYRSNADPDYVLKVPMDNGAFGLSLEKRMENQVDASKKHPDLFPEAEETGKRAVRQKYVKGGTTLREAMERGKYDTAFNIFRKLKRVHDAGYKHGDVNSTNLGEFGEEGYLSFDTETFSKGDWREDLGRAMETGERHNPGFMPKVIEKVYGSSVLEELRN